MLTAEPTTQQQPMIRADNEDVMPSVDDSPTLASPALPPPQASIQAPQNSAVRQTRSRRVITNTSRYDQSMAQ